MTATPVGMRCPECARQRTHVTRLRETVTRPTLTYALIAINTVIELVEIGTGGTLSGVGTSSLVVHGDLSRPAIANGDYWRLVSSGFIHAGIIHLALNMWVLYILGSLLEPAIGRLRLGILYAVSLLAGSFGVLVSNQAAIGASGAIFGLMGAAVIVMRQRGISVMQSGLPVWIGLNLLLTVTIPGISLGAHIGGLIGGTLAAIAMFEAPVRLRVPAHLGTALASVLGVGAVVASLAIAHVS